ncbi:MAG: hypothetical protein P4L40_01515 [Terracidiphilus sp.]|nr:hypothetical protein [Terracidiphilus sp.]
MPVKGNTFVKGDLFIKFNVKFPKKGSLPAETLGVRILPLCYRCVYVCVSVRVCVCVCPDVYVCTLYVACASGPDARAARPH